MATTSIWRVKGWLGKVVIYVENPDKTDNPAFFEKQDMSDRQAQGLSDVIDYAVNSEKTQKTDDEQAEVLRSFVSGVNCHPGTAREEMLAVKKRFGKEDGTVAYHGYQSFAPGEATPEMAHEIGLKLAQRLWGEKYQVLVTTHLDKENHLHNHFVLNTVSFVDGIKYHRTAKDYHDMQVASDALCREYGLSVIENPKRGKGQSIPRPVDMNTYGQSRGHSGSYSTNWQITGRELLDAAEVRMLDNRYALLFIRGERPILDEKYDILKHPNVALSADGKAKPYEHGKTDNAVASISFADVPATDMPETELPETNYELLSDEDIEALFL